jgi:myo-inositol-1(or 4)-monophosphatase
VGRPPPAAVSTDDLLDVAVAAARASAAVLLDYYEHGVREVAAKSTPTDLVSEADLEAERAIRELIVARRPDDAILGEEGDDIAGSTGLRWVVDPLDGTINYLFRIPQWSVSVACEGQVGVVLDPLRDELFTVRLGEPAFLNGEPLRGSAREDVATAMVATGFGYDARVRAAQAAVVARLLPQVRVGLGRRGDAVRRRGPRDPPPRRAAGHRGRAARRGARDRRCAGGDRHRMTSPAPRPTARRPGASPAA